MQNKPTFDVLEKYINEGDFHEIDHVSIDFRVIFYLKVKALITKANYRKYFLKVVYRNKLIHLITLSSLEKDEVNPTIQKFNYHLNFI